MTLDERHDTKAITFSPQMESIDAMVMVATAEKERGLSGISFMASNDDFTTTVSTNATNDASESGLNDEYETNDHRRMMFMALLVLCGLTILYFGYCACYLKVNWNTMKLDWNTVEDIITIRTRDRQRIANQVRKFLFRLNNRISTVLTMFVTMLHCFICTTRLCSMRVLTLHDVHGPMPT